MSFIEVEISSVSSFFDFKLEVVFLVVSMLKNRNLPPLGHRFAGRSSGLCGAHPGRHDVRARSGNQVGRYSW